MNSLYEILESKKDLEYPIYFQLNEKSIDEYTYSNLLDRIKELLNIFENNNLKGKRVLINAQNNIETIALIISLLKLNCQIFLTNDLSKINVMDYDLCLNSTHEHLWYDNYFSPNIPRKISGLERNHDSGIGVFTSGSTGTPKEVFFTEKELISKFSGNVCDGKDKYYTPTDVSSISGLIRNLIKPILLEHRTYLRSGYFTEKTEFIDKFYKDIYDNKITHIYGIKNIFDDIPKYIKDNFDFSYVKELILSGEIYHVKHIEQILSSLKNIDVSSLKHLYGSTEACGTVSYTTGNELEPIYISESYLKNNIIVFTRNKKDFYMLVNDEVKIIECYYDEDDFVDILPIDINEKIKFESDKNMCLSNINLFYDNKWNETGDVGIRLNNKFYILGRKNDIIKINDKIYILSLIENHLKKITDCPISAFEKNNSLAICICIDENINNPNYYKEKCKELYEIKKSMLVNYGENIDIHIMDKRAYPKAKSSNKVLRKEIIKILDDNSFRDDKKAIRSLENFLRSDFTFKYYISPYNDTDLYSLIKNNIISNNDEIVIRNVTPETAEDYMMKMLVYKYVYDVTYIENNLRIRLNDNLYINSYNDNSIYDRIPIYVELNNSTDLKKYRKLLEEDKPIGYSNLYNLSDGNELIYLDTVLIKLHGQKFDYYKYKDGNLSKINVSDKENFVEEVCFFSNYSATEYEEYEAYRANMQSEISGKKLYLVQNQVSFKKEDSVNLNLHSNYNIIDDNKIQTEFPEISTPVKKFIRFLNDDNSKNLYAINFNDINDLDYIKKVINKYNIEKININVNELYEQSKMNKNKFEKILERLILYSNKNLVINLETNDFFLNTIPTRKPTKHWLNCIQDKQKFVEELTIYLNDKDTKHINYNGVEYNIDTSNIKIILSITFDNISSYYDYNYKIKTEAISDNIKKIYNNKIELNSQDLNFPQELILSFNSITRKFTELSMKLSEKGSAIYYTDFLNLIWDLLVDSREFKKIEDISSVYLQYIEEMVNINDNVSYVFLPNSSINHYDSIEFKDNNGHIIELDKEIIEKYNEKLKSIHDDKNYKKYDIFNELQADRWSKIFINDKKSFSYKKGLKFLFEKDAYEKACKLFFYGKLKGYLPAINHELKCFDVIDRTILFDDEKKFRYVYISKESLTNPEELIFIDKNGEYYDAQTQKIDKNIVKILKLID